MSFKIDGVEPTSINYNGTDLTSVKMDNQMVWGKPYTLSLSVGSNVTLVVNRTSSPNQNASTGNLSNGSLVYYGDVLQISASASTNYKISTFTVNGSNFTSGNTITVSSAVTISVAAVEDVYWRTIWSGSLEVGWTSQPGNADTALRSTSKSVTVSGVVANKPTRITFASVTVRQVSDGSEKAKVTATPNATLNTCAGYYADTTGTNLSKSGQSNGHNPVSSKYCSIMIDTPTAANTLNVRMQYYTEKATALWITKYGCTWYSSCVISKIEQYY